MNYIVQILKLMEKKKFKNAKIRQRIKQTQYILGFKKKTLVSKTFLSIYKNKHLRKLESLINSFMAEVPII